MFESASATSAFRPIATKSGTAASDVVGVRRGKAALSSGCKSHPATAPAGAPGQSCCRSRRPPDTELRGRLRELANQRRRFGYRRLFILLQEEGEPSSINRIYRLYREEGLEVRGLAMCLAVASAFAAPPKIEAAIKTFKAIGADPAKLEIYSPACQLQSVALQRFLVTDIDPLDATVPASPTS